jgi:membrane protein YdbS with pleckstrin-like domain
MKIPPIPFIKKTGKLRLHTVGPNDTEPASEGNAMFESRPSGRVVVLAYLLAVLFCFFAHQFFDWFPPYLREIFKNLRGLPVAWADQILLWGERILALLAAACALYHHLWQLGTRYRLTAHDIRVETWFPTRRVKAVPYGAVRHVGYQQSPAGLVFRYGHIEIDTGGSGGPLVIVNCPRPAEFTAALQDKVEAVLRPSLKHQS